MRDNNNNNNKNKENSNNKKFSNKRKPFSKRNESYDNKDMKDSESKEGIPWKNDWKFYAASEQIAKDIASIPFNVLNGVDFPLEMIQSAASNSIVITNGQRPLPGVLALDYIPSVGINNNRTDGINMAATQLYTYVRHANSGAKNYEPADMMMYILAMKDIYSEYFEIKRAIGISKSFNYYNHNLPDLVLGALGIDPDDLRANISQYRGRLNLLAEKINSFAVPSYFKAFDRAAYISSYIFSDSSSVRGQFYAFRKAGYYTWSGTTSTTGTELVFKPHAHVLDSLDSRLDILESQLDAIFLDEDALTMSGDILKAFNEPKLYTVQLTNEDYGVVPLFDTDILAQIENCTVLNKYNQVDSPTPSEYYNLDITQNNQLITFNPELRYRTENSLMLNFKSYAFNSHKDEPQYTDVLEWSRLISTFDDVATAVPESSGVYEHIVKVKSCGLELITSLHIFTYNGDGNSFTEQTIPQVIHSGVSTNVDDLLARLADLMQFDWHPFVYVVDHTTDGTNPSNHIHVMGDCKVVTVIGENVIKRINDSACYSAYFARDLY